MKNIEIVRVTNLLTSMILDNENLFNNEDVRIYTNGENLYIENYPLKMNLISLLIECLDLTNYTFTIDNNLIIIK
jgi:hypothetical protein